MLEREGRTLSADLSYLLGLGSRSCSDLSFRKTLGTLSGVYPPLPGFPFILGTVWKQILERSWPTEKCAAPATTPLRGRADPRSAAALHPLLPSPGSVRGEPRHSPLLPPPWGWGTLSPPGAPSPGSSLRSLHTAPPPPPSHTLSPSRVYPTPSPPCPHLLRDRGGRPHTRSAICWALVPAPASR
jgi:hypothetical protein